MSIVPGKFSRPVYMRRSGDSYILSAKIPQVQWKEDNGYKYMLGKELDENREIDWLRTKNVSVIKAPIKNDNKSAAYYPDIYSRTHPSPVVSMGSQPQEDISTSASRIDTKAVQRIHG